jgi:cyclopropane fatty-acyl-phospholipid synthase-like methyltransferase
VGDEPGASAQRADRKGEAELAARVLIATWREGGLAGCARKLRAAVALGLPVVIAGGRTAQSVGAYFDLITADARLFYGESFHLGYFSQGSESLREALDAHTDLVAELARVQAAAHVLDVGCGLGAPALRIARRYGCRITGVNISREQVRQGRELIAACGLVGRVVIQRGDARALEFPDGCFDAIICLEAAGDICVTEADKGRLVGELFRVLRPGGHVGFSDLALRACPSPPEDRALRALLYHSGAELVTDWPAIFARHGFQIVECRDIITETLPTWEHARAVYERRDGEVTRRYGRRLADRIRAHLERIPAILATHGSFPAFCAHKPNSASDLSSAPLHLPVVCAKSVPPRNPPFRTP